MNIYIYIYYLISSPCVFHIDKVFIIRPNKNTTVQMQYISILLYNAACFGCPDQP